MAASILSKSALLRLYDEARKNLAPESAVLHVAGLTGLDPVVIESEVQGREAEMPGLFDMLDELEAA